MRKLPLMLYLTLLLCLPAALADEINLSENYSIRAAAEQARFLLDHGGQANIGRVEALLNSVLSCQETRSGAAHHGNFLWESKDDVIQDVNSVEFTLTHLIPLFRDHKDLLSQDHQRRVEESIRLGLEEIRNMDVALTYTNIAAMDCCNSCLGGELLGEKALFERGYRRFKEFAGLITGNGTVFEFNSPTYTQVTMKALALLQRYSKDPSTRLLAKLMSVRLGLSAALHVHPVTGRLAGPYSRAYYPTLEYTSPAYSEVVQDWITEGVIPSWIGDAVKTENLPLSLEETASAGWKIGASTYLAPSFSMGLASREVSRQTNSIVIQVNTGEDAGSGLICSRYSVNDSLDEEPSPDKHGGIDISFFDDGKFFGVQHGSRAIGVYAPRGAETPDSFAPCSQHRYRSARGSLVWLNRELVKGIWVGEEEVKQIPHRVKPGEVVVMETGPVYIAVRPLSKTDLGCDSPILISESKGRLYLDMYNYLGPEKVFGELDRGSRFYKGQPQCAFYIEVMEKDKEIDASAVAKKVAAGSIRDDAAPAVTSYHDNKERPWVLEYVRDGQKIGLEVDLMQWQLLRRWTEKGDLGWPMLESPIARQNREGWIEVEGATLTCGKEPALLYGDPSGGLWVACYYGEPAPLALSVPGGAVRVEQMGPGMICWEKGTVTVEALNLSGEPVVEGGVLTRENVTHP